jgi:hypothetical protein
LEGRADLPALGFGGGVVQVVLLVGHMGQQLLDGFARAASAGGGLRPRPFDQHHTATVVQLREGLVGPLGRRFGRHHLRRRPDVFARVVSVEDAGRITEVAGVNVPAPRATVRREEHLLGLAVTALHGQSPE